MVELDSIRGHLAVISYGRRTSLNALGTRKRVHRDRQRLRVRSPKYMSSWPPQKWQAYTSC